MSYLKVLLARDTDNVNSLPDEWPVEANPCAQDSQLEPPYLKETVEEFNTRKARLQDEYDLWYEKNVGKRDRIKREMANKKDDICNSGEYTLSIYKGLTSLYSTLTRGNLIREIDELNNLQFKLKEIEDLESRL